MTAIDVVERLRVADLDDIFQTRRIDMAEHRAIVDELRHIGHVHAEMGAMASSERWTMPAPGAARLADAIRL